MACQHLFDVYQLPNPGETGRKKRKKRAKGVHVRPRQPLQRVEAEARVFDEDGALNLKDSLAFPNS